MHILLRKGLVFLIIVEKYGGSSIDSTIKLRNIAKHIKEEMEKDVKMVIVISAKYHKTDEIIKLAEKVNPFCKDRELDALLGLGELESASLLTLALKEIGIEAISLNAWQIPIMVTNNYQNGKIISIKKETIKRNIQRKVVVVPGFQGINKSKELVTLGRGGSDTIAIALAGVLKAPCIIYTDVEGVFTIDPKKVKESKHLSTISFDEMVEISASGNKIIAPRAIILAKEMNVDVVIKKLGGERMTVINDKIIEKRLITCITSENLIKGKIKEEELTKFLTICHNENIIIENIHYHNKKWHLSLLEKDSHKLNGIRDNIKMIRSKKKYGQITIVGLGLKNRYQEIYAIYQLLTNIMIYDLYQSDFKIKIVIDKSKQKEVLLLLNDYYQLNGVE